MMNKQSSSNNNVIQEAKEYKTCAGRNCKDIQTHFFKMALMIGSAWFCNECKKNLEKDGYAFYNTTENTLEIKDRNLVVQADQDKDAGSHNKEGLQ